MGLIWSRWIRLIHICMGLTINRLISWFMNRSRNVNRCIRSWWRRISGKWGNLNERLRSVSWLSRDCSRLRCLNMCRQPSCLRIRIGWGNGRRLICWRTCINNDRSCFSRNVVHLHRVTHVMSCYWGIWNCVLRMWWVECIINRNCRYWDFRIIRYDVTIDLIRNHHNHNHILALVMLPI